MNFKNVEEKISTYKFETNGNYRDYEIFFTDMARDPIFFGAADFKRRYTKKNQYPSQHFGNN